LLLIVLFLGLAVGTQAQQVGSLTGKITDKENGEALVGATVMLVGTYKGGAADFNGVYTINNLKPGDYSIKVSFVGYTEKIFTGIRIKAGEPTKLNAQISQISFTHQTVEVIGERQVVDLESGKSEVRISAGDIKEMNVKNVQDIIAQQAGVSQSPDGLQIRGGRVYETQFRVDGINATDPLAGTGFGVEVSSGSVADVTLVTGGADAEYNGTSGIVLTKVKEGSDKFQVSGSWQRDNFGKNVNKGSAWNSDIVDLSIGGPLTKNKKLRFFISGNGSFNDTYYRLTANQLQSSITAYDKTFAPRQDNKVTNTTKLSYRVNDKIKVSLTNQHSILINQNTRTLQVVGFDQIMAPGLQFPFANLLDNATTYTHRTNLTAANIEYSIGKNYTFIGNVGRLFTNLRADANGRPFRDATVDKDYDPRSIPTQPGIVYPSQDSTVQFTLPGNGLYNNPNGITTTWHDHYVQEYTIKAKMNYLSDSKRHFMSFGFEHKIQELQWVDVTSPWVGASIIIPGIDTLKSARIGSSSDVWKVKTNQGSIFYQDEIKYKGIIATLGTSLEYWRPGKYAEDAVANPKTPLPDQTRQDFTNHTYNIVGARYKARLLPRVRVSFPVTENQVMYFNYGHSMRLAHPRFVYGGLNTTYLNRAEIGDLGNPAINPEVAVSYEVGIKGQINRDFGYTFTAFYKDYFDFIVSRSVVVRGVTGALETKAFSFNQDYARVRGAEIMVSYRLTKNFKAMANAAYQVATGKSNTAAESRFQIINQGNVDLTKEQYMAWDRPLDLKGTIIFTPDTSMRLFGIPLKNTRVFVSSTWKSGLRYTPVVLVGTDAIGRPHYELDSKNPYSKIGSAWRWTDIKISRDFPLGKRRAISFSVELNNIFNNKNAQIINNVTGTAYKNGDQLPYAQRDPNYPSPLDSGVPPSNPARYMQPRHIMYGIAFNF